MSAHGSVFDIGTATAEAFNRIAAGTAPLQAGGRGENSNNNGSLMRMLSAGIYCAVTCSDEKLADNISSASAITHAHPRSKRTALSMLF